MVPSRRRPRRSDDPGGALAGRADRAAGGPGAASDADGPCDPAGAAARATDRGRGKAGDAGPRDGERAGPGYADTGGVAASGGEADDLLGGAFLARRTRDPASARHRFAPTIPRRTAPPRPPPSAPSGMTV